MHVIANRALSPVKQSSTLSGIYVPKTGLTSPQVEDRHGTKARLAMTCLHRVIANRVLSPVKQSSTPS
jgi:hypothetical protein